MGDVRSRFGEMTSGQMAENTLPSLEWAGWWVQTISRWRAEGLPAELEIYDIKRHLGLGVNYQIWFGWWTEGAAGCVA